MLRLRETVTGGTKEEGYRETGARVADPVDILLVEDNAGDQRLVTEALVGTTSRVHVVGDGVAAMAFLRKLGERANAPCPSLIILDLNLPHKSGREVLEEIKNDRNLRRIPVIVFSTSTSEKDVSACYNLHANCYVAKPMDLEDFFRTVKWLFHFWIEIAQHCNGASFRSESA